MLDPLSAARVRAQRFWYRDGLSEIIVGIVVLLSSGWLLVSAPGNSSAWWYFPATLIYVLLFVALALRAPRILAAVRERITYARSGYVSVGESKRRIVLAVFFLMLSAAVAVLTLHHGNWDPNRWIQWLPAVCGVAVATLSVYVYARHALPRFLVVGAISIVLGVVVSVEYSYRVATTLYDAGIGCALLCSGGLTLWKYLQPRPPSAYET